MKHCFYCLFILLPLLLHAQSAAQDYRDHTGERAVPSDPHTLASNMRSDTVDILNYTINLNITDFTTNTIAGNTQVKFTPKVNGISKLDLDLLMLTIDSIRSGTTVLTYSYNDTLLEVNLPSVYNTGDTSAVTVYYHGTPQGDASGWGGFYFQSGYAYNLGVGFAALPHNYGRVWYPCFDNFVERATYEFNITTNGGKIAMCNGALAADTTDGSGNRSRRWIMDRQIPSYLASVTVAAYAEIHQSYSGINGTIPIIIAAVPSDTTAVKASFIHLPLALSMLEGHFGAFRWNRVGYCMVPFNSGAMEHATNISYPKVTATGSTTYENLFAHELSHHWFGDLATCRTAEDMWLNEGWAHYCEYLFYEALNGYNSYLSGIRSNHEDVIQFAHNKEGGYLTLSDIPQTYTYGDHVYNKGADVAHTMRGYMGDSLFFSSVKTYLANNQYTDVSSTDFMNALTAASGMDMSDFFNDWVFHPGYPHFSIDSTVVTPAGPGYNVTVYVKQKLTGAPSYFTNVPLDLTFKAADWTEQTQRIVMSGAAMSFNFTLPFNPVFTAVDMNEKISHAVAPDYKTLKTLTTASFSNAKMTITPYSVTDSVFVRVEHNFTAPDGFHACCRPYRLSPNHYWKVDGILSAGFKAKAVIYYDGRTASYSGNYWLDNLLNITTEDSLVLMYRRNAGDDWQEYPYYTKNIQGNATDKRGMITIDTLQLGEYVFAMMDPAMGIQDPATPKQASVSVYPNPSQSSLTVNLSDIKELLTGKAVLLITDVSGKTVLAEKLGAHQESCKISTSELGNAIYFVVIKNASATIAKSKFIVSH